MTTEQERKAYRKLAELVGLDGAFANRYDGDRKPQPRPETPVTPVDPPTHYNLDLSFVALTVALTDAEQDALMEAVKATVNGFDFVDFVDTLTVGEA